MVSVFKVFPQDSLFIISHLFEFVKHFFQIFQFFRKILTYSIFCDLSFDSFNIISHSALFVKHFFQSFLIFFSECVLTFWSATLSLYHILGKLSSGFNRRIKISPPNLFPLFVIFPALFRVLCYYIMDFDNCQQKNQRDFY